MTTYFINTNERDTPAKISGFLNSIGYEGPEGYYGAPVYCIKIDSQSRTYGFLGAPVPPCKNLTTLDGIKQLMATHYINVTPSVTLSKITTALYNLGFASCPNTPMPAEVAFLKINKETKTFSCHRDSDQREGIELMAPEQLKPQVMPKPSYEWLEKQCTTLKKQLSALGYEDRGGGMMAPPLGKTPEYVLNDLSPEQAIQAFKDGKSVTVAGKPMTSGTTIEELLDSRLTLKHKRFGRIVLTDQVTDAPEVGTPVFYESIDKEVIEDKFATYMQGLLGSGCLHYTEQGAIDHAEEMARLNRDGFVETGVEWLVKLKNELSTVLCSIEEKQLLEASRRMVEVTDEISKKIGEF